jgi:hypothetical protein
MVSNKENHQNLKQVLIIFILLAALVGCIPNLLVGAGEDLLGVCGFTEQICKNIKLQGAVKVVLAVALSFTSVFLGVMTSIPK